MPKCVNTSLNMCHCKKRYRYFSSLYCIQTMLDNDPGGQVWERTHARPEKHVKRGFFWKTTRDVFRGAKTLFFRKKRVSQTSLESRLGSYIIFSQNVPFIRVSKILLSWWLGSCLSVTFIKLILVLGWNFHWRKLR